MAARYLFDDAQDLGSYPLSSTSEMRMSLIPKTNGQWAVGMREFVDEGPKGYQGPSKNGVLFTADALEAVIVALKRAQKQLFDSASV
jgi:hypothetical protein